MRLGLSAGLLLLALMTVPCSAMPQCGGHDLLAAIEARDPDLYRHIRKEGAALANTEANLWRIERAGAKPSYLFATVHVSDPRVTEMPAAARNALAAARTVAVEVTGVNDQSMAEAMDAMADKVVLPEGERLTNHLNADDRVALSRVALEMGTDSLMLDRIQPWFVGVMLALPVCEQQRLAGGLEPLDGLIEAEAFRQGAEVVGLETIEEQLEKLADMPFEIQLANLQLTLRNAGSIEDMNETLIRLYREHRTGEVWPLTLALSGDKALAKKVIDEFQQRLIDERNLVMRDRALPLLENGNAFIAVGALHLPGDKGLVALFREAGYTITPVE